MEDHLTRFESFIGVNFWTALFVLLNFLTVLLVAKHYLMEPVMSIIRKRQEQIDRLYREAGSAKEQALEMEAEYRHRLADAARVGDELVRQATARGQEKEAQILHRAKAQAEEILEKAAADIASEKKAAIRDTQDQITDIAIILAQKILERQLTSVDQDRLVEDFIRDLEEPQ